MYMLTMCPKKLATSKRCHWRVTMVYRQIGVGAKHSISRIHFCSYPFPLLQPWKFRPQPLVLKSFEELFAWPSKIRWMPLGIWYMRWCRFFATYFVEARFASNVSEHTWSWPFVLLVRKEIGDCRRFHQAVSGPASSSIDIDSGAANVIRWHRCYHQILE